MKTVLRRFLISKRERRNRLLRISVWLLERICDAENAEILSNWKKLGAIAATNSVLYLSVEGEYLSNEHALTCLESALRDLEFVY
ncbi:MAG: hypothetical protein FWF88_04835 [Peptococcaceae bacterium]|nr:hypothetical protein [Peptococcaceae bacterium]